jgi:DNA-binding transcriptional MocR family regulator
MLIDSIRHFAAFSGNNVSTRSTRSTSSRNLNLMPRKKQRLVHPRGRCFSTSSSSATSDEDFTSLDHTGSDSVNSNSKISSRRAGAAVELLPTYLSDARAVQRYHPTEAPDGALQLCVAENQMLEDLLVPALSSFTSAPTSFAADMIYYQPTHGRPSARMAMARYLERTLGGLPEELKKNEKSLDPEGLVMGAGCNAVLENLCICLADAGDAVLIPTPYYAAFEFDLVARAGTFPFMFLPHHLILSICTPISSNSFVVSSYSLTHVFSFVFVIVW